jgi:hypothetical protein
MPKLTPSEQAAVDRELRLIFAWLTGPHVGSDTCAWQESIKPLYDQLAFDIFHRRYRDSRD